MRLGGSAHVAGDSNAPRWAFFTITRTSTEKGYPAGLQGSEIPIVSRIVTVIAFDAIVSSRP